MSKVTGVAPGFLLLPAREYSWELVRRVTLKVPNTGNIQELLNKERVASNVSFPGEPEFTIFEDNLLQLWQIVRVLFAETNYPALADDECLNVVALEFQDNVVTCMGK